MPGISEVQDTVQSIYEKYKSVDAGAVATYIPELSKANPDQFGICLATADGHLFHAGDREHEFTIQSICKPFAFQLAVGGVEQGESVGARRSGTQR
jgi:glutaminase